MNKKEVRKLLDGMLVREPNDEPMEAIIILIAPRANGDEVNWIVSDDECSPAINLLSIAALEQVITEIKALK